MHFPFLRTFFRYCFGTSRITCHNSLTQPRTRTLPKTLVWHNRDHMHNCRLVWSYRIMVNTSSEENSSKGQSVQKNLRHLASLCSRERVAIFESFCRTDSVCMAYQFFHGLARNACRNLTHTCAGLIRNVYRGTDA